MAGFRKAKAEQAALKVGMYGNPGTGKTLTALMCLEGLANRSNKRYAYVDTERGTDFYCQKVADRKVHPEAFDFDCLYTRSITEVLAAVKSLDPNEYCGVCIDSITHIWEAAKLAYTGKLTKVGTLPFHAWGKIKAPYKELISFLLSSPLHVFFCGRQGNVFEEDEETGEMKKVGEKMKAEGETAYEPHILIHMEVDRTKSGEGVIRAFAEKDRTGILAGKVFVNPSFETLIAPLIPLLGDKQATIQSDDEVGSKDAEALDEAERSKSTKSAEILRQFTGRILACASMDALKQISKEITAELKREMTSADVATLREKYLEAEGFLKGATTN